MASIKLNVNSKDHTVDVDPSTPLLWVLRDHLDLVGTKFGCGVASCGACTVHLNGSAIRSCVTPVARLAGKKIVTIEGLDPEGNHPVQKAWKDHDVPQCGYCQAGQIMSAVALLKENSSPNDRDIDDFMQGNLCRCGTYLRIKEAIKSAALNK